MTLVGIFPVMRHGKEELAHKSGRSRCYLKRRKAYCESRARVLTMTDVGSNEIGPVRRNTRFGGLGGGFFSVADKRTDNTDMGPIR